ncbi:P-loop containing nucleoside triphosphate hydrolase [Glarea lozoyensis ATCC 20868]|uniref:p-loop containing nucleoside triphosphate hydrolase n=1 Tax=Glarea lozoyensis (strain ATCC 20868 / MF5171) TaxID=1116229 RepID=S3CMT4_GLAL2|nr:P-loop containing nucleoside triphosphate hydrolase [Glarea lozoyensis ATCC 20868]EPE27045.1 P-loop containing nucleoside triphosphate hydrolase [Glarea lozoyensis ATCC 20868]
MAETEAKDRIPTGPQFSEAVASFLYDSLNDATKSLVVRLKNPESRPSQDEDHTPPGSETGSDSPLSLFNVPHSRNKKFCGRVEALKELFAMWKPKAQNRIAIVGLGGIGKTELMIEFVYRLRDVSPKTQISWFKSEDLLTTPESNSSSTTGMQLDRWLKLEHNVDSLVVVDTADDFGKLLQKSEGDGNLLEELKAFSGSVIVMARNTQTGRQLAGPNGLCEVGELDEEASTKLLRGSLGPLAHSTSSELEEVAQLMVYLPLAILQVGKLITSAGMTVAQFLYLYKSSPSMKLRLFGKVDRFSNPDPRFSVTGQGVVDVRAFRSEFPDATRILFQLYYLGGDLVPLALFSATDPLDMLIIMFILKGHFFVAEVGSSGTYTLHPLVCLAMQNLFKSVRPETDKEDVVQERKWFEEIMITFSEWYPDAESEDRAWWRTCFAHILNDCDLQVNSLRLAIAKIHRKEAAYFKRRGGYLDALRMTSLAKDVLSVSSTAEHLGVLQDQIELLDILGRYREIKSALEIYPVDEEEQTVLWRKRIQARLDQAQGVDRYDSAITTFKLISDARDGPNNSKTDLLQSIDDYGWALMLKGCCQEASIKCRSALAGRTSSFGISHTDTLSSLRHLSCNLRLQGKYEEALQYAHQAIRGSEILLGTNHPTTLLAQITKCKILLATAVTTEDLDNLEALLVNSANHLTPIISDNHPVILTCRSDRALIKQRLGKYAAAEQMNRATLLSRESGPWEHSQRNPDTLTSKHQLTELLFLKEGAKAADLLSEEVCQLRTEVLTSGTLKEEDFHPDQLSSLHLRAMILSELGQHNEALEEISLVLEARLSLLGANHSDVYSTQTSKAEILRLQLPSETPKRTMMLNEIDSLNRTALDGLTQIFGSQHQSTLRALTHLALGRSERGKDGHEEAASLLGVAYIAYRNSVGDEHPETSWAKGRLADALGRVGKWDEGRRLWRECVGGWARAEGVGSYLYGRACGGLERFLARERDVMGREMVVIGKERVREVVRSGKVE